MDRHRYASGVVRYNQTLPNCFLNTGSLYLALSVSARALRHEICSSAKTLRCWFRIPLEAWMPTCVFFVLSCVGSGLATGWSPVQGLLPTVYKINNFIINSGWNRPDSLIRKLEEREVLLSVHACINTDILEWSTYAVCMKCLPNMFQCMIMILHDNNCNLGHRRTTIK
jgi:hypothetical protein